MNRDNQYLDLLSIFHFVMAGLTALVACFPLIHLTMGILMLTGGLDEPGEPVPAFLGWMFTLIPAVMILTGWALSIVMVMAGFKLKKRTAPVFCMVVAGFECMLFPLGTVLGVFTLIMLTRPEIRDQFASA